MDKRVLSGFFLVSFIFSQLALAASIELKDGSKINGQVLSLNGGYYKIYSKSVGVLKIPQSKVRAIHENGALVAKRAKPKSNTSTLDLTKIQKKIMANKGFQQSIMNLQSGSGLQAILQDQTILRAIQNQDFSALSRNPKIIELMNDPEIRKITNGLK